MLCNDMLLSVKQDSILCVGTTDQYKGGGRVPDTAGLGVMLAHPRGPLARGGRPL